MTNNFDVIIIGAGAAGLMCAIEAGRQNKRVLLLERNKKPGAKILISGGGRCNFTNQEIDPVSYISENPHFAKSALSRYTPWDFMDLIAAHGLTWHEKTLGQLFCDQGAKAILKALLDECRGAGVEILTSVDVRSVEKIPSGFVVSSAGVCWQAPQLVIACGGVSIPKMGATDFGYRVARQFGLEVVEPVPALVPLTFDPETAADMKLLAGVSAPCRVAVAGQPRLPAFRENLLFTHRGLSGPAILQISSYLRPGEAIEIDLLPDEADAWHWISDNRNRSGGATVKTVLASQLPDRLAEQIALAFAGKLAEQSNATLSRLCDRIKRWRLTPTGDEGFAKAEVTRGGVSTEEVSSKTMEAKSVPGLYFIGECVDVTGWLGGYNFQWAWASGHAAGQAVALKA